MRYDPLVLTNQAVAMQRIADYVRSGHVFWTSGEVPMARARALVHKFDRLYGVSRTRNQRATDKSHGLVGATLILYCPHTPEQSPHTVAIRWVLLLTVGDSPAYAVEKLQDARDRETRLRWGDYELLQIARSGQQKPAWSWRMRQQAYLVLQESGSKGKNCSSFTRWSGRAALGRKSPRRKSYDMFNDSRTKE